MSQILQHKKLNGQIWIDAKSPYRLKYRYNDTNYIVQVVQSYTLNDVKSGETINTGMLMSKTTEGIRAAVFPEDINNIIGIAYVNEDQVLSIDDGELYLTYDTVKEIDNLYGSSRCFVEANVSPNVGDPIYWDLNNSGKITLLQPNGIKDYNSITNEADYAKNVGYINLPQIGTVKSILYTDETKTTISTLIIDITLSNFTQSISWYWPKNYKDNSGHTKLCGYIVGKNENQSFEINHNLFKSQSTCFGDCKVISIDKDNNEYNSLVDVTNDFSNKKTTINVHSMGNLRYFVSGTVYYNATRG